MGRHLVHKEEDLQPTSLKLELQEVGRKNKTGNPVAGPSEEGTLADFQRRGTARSQGLEQGQEACLLVEVQLRGPVLARGHRKPPKGVKQGRQF